MNTDLFQWFTTLGVGGILAGGMFYFYRKDVKTYTDLWKGQSEMLLEVVKENTVAFTKLTEVINALHKRSDHIEDVLEKQGLGFARHRHGNGKD